MSNTITDTRSTARPVQETGLGVLRRPTSRRWISPRGRTAVAGCAAALLVAFTGCSAPDEAPFVPPGDVYPPFPFPESSPGLLGLDTMKLESARSSAADRPWINSIVMLWRDTLVFEYYVPPRSKYHDDDLRSVTKSVVSLLVGRALADGQIDSVDARFLDVVPAYRSPELDARVGDLSLRHLLAMRAGFDYVDGGRNADVVARSADWVAAFLRLPLLWSPGTQFAYSSPQAHLVSVAVSHVAGMTTAAYARERLFEPLRITARAWEKDPVGYSNGGVGLWLTPRDMARVGQLVLHRGMIDGHQIVPAEWIDSSKAPRNAVSTSWGDLGRVNYGYLWWIPVDVGPAALMAVGYAGQYILVDPSRDVVIVSTADPYVDGLTASEHEKQLQTIFAGTLLTAIPNR